MDKPHTQAQTTRQRNKEARAEREAQERQDKALVVDAMRAVLRDPEATTDQRLFAVAVLDKVKYYNFVPHDIGSADALIADFAKRLEEAQEK